MKCIRPDLSEKLVLYVEHLLAADEQKEVESHIAGCELCRDEAQALQDNIRLIRESASSNSGAASSLSCPDDRMLVEFSESPDSLAPGDRKMVESHIESCRECQSILESLQELSGEIEHFQDVPDRSVTIPEAVKLQISSLYKREAVRAESFFDRIIRFFSKPRYSVISALAALLLIAGAFTIIQGDMTGRHKSEVSAPPSTQALLTMRPGDESLRRDLKTAGEGSSVNEEVSLSPQKAAVNEMQQEGRKQKAIEKEKENQAISAGKKDLADSLKSRDKGFQAPAGGISTASKMTAGEANRTANSAQDNAFQGAGSGGYAPGNSPLAGPGGAPGRYGYGMGGSGGGAPDGTGGTMQGRIGAGSQSSTDEQPDIKDNLIVGGSQNIQAQQYSHTDGLTAPSSQNIKKEADDKKVKAERERYTSTDGSRGNTPAQQPAAPSSAWVAGRTATAPPSMPRAELQKAPAAAEPPKPSMARVQEGAAEAKKQRDSEKERLERELAAAGQSYLDRAIGVEKAKITVVIITDDRKASPGIKKIHVVIKSTCALKDKEKTSLVQGISEKLGLKSDRDSVQIEVSPAH